MADELPPEFVPKFTPSCSVCGAIVGKPERHVWWHGMIWRVVLGDPHAIDEASEARLRALLREWEEKDSG